MNLQQLLARYAEHTKIKSIATLLANPDSLQRLQMTGMSGSQEAFLLAAIAQSLDGLNLVIAFDKEDAAYLQNDLANITDAKKVHFFPDSFKRPAHFEELNTANVLQRTELINKVICANPAKQWVITYPEALFEMVVSPQVLEEAKIEINTGEALDVDFLISVLIEYGFERTDFVYEPGQFSIRGGIVDVFSYGNEYPYRIELFDVEVESIRTFNPGNQLSIQKISKVSIVPNINTRFTQDQKTSLFQILPANSVLWIKDMEATLDKLQICFEKAATFSETVSALDQSELAEIFKDRAFIYPNQVVKEAVSFSTVLLSAGKQQIAVQQKFSFNARPQPSFNKNFKLLIENLHENANNLLENFIFSDNFKQLERFEAIFEDLAAKVKYTPVLVSLHQGFIDNELNVACYTDHQIFERFHQYRLRAGFTKDQALTVNILRELHPGDFVTHIDHGVGRYSGLEKININGHIQEAVRLVYKNHDMLYVSIHSLHKIAKYVGQEGNPPTLNKLGSDTWKTLKAKTKAKVKDIAKELIQLYAKRRASKGFAFSPDGYLQNELEASFLYEDTPDQLSATNDVKEDMCKPYPMDRLICGDVGFGKTEVAMRAAFKAVNDGKQVAILVPTTILALQHFKTFGERLKEFGVEVDYVNRFKTAKEKKETLERLKSGQLDIIIGTHALASKDVVFKDLGLLIIDEEQKFGVATKEKLRNFKVNVDTLTLTATPIPRTLQFSLMSARDLSIIRTAPPNRQPIHTEVRVFSDEVIKDSIYKEVLRGGQVFFVHNRVQSLGDMRAMIERLCPDIDVSMAHGQMEPEKLEKTLVEFIERKHDVLVCTNIIETGLDIANANTIIINNAHQFGMSDLHQLRGRVGRSNRKAYCYLFCPPLSVLTPEARKRLRTLEEFSDLGSGFNIAMRDLDIRGAGNLLGGEQSGFIADIGYETYMKILDEAVQELKETEFKDVFKEDLAKERKYVRDVEIETDVEMHIPDDYVDIIQERLNLYTELDSIENETQLTEYQAKLTDRFGKIPKATMELFEGLRLRWISKKLGLERIVLKESKLRAYFVTNPQSTFYETETFKQIIQLINSPVGIREKISLKQSSKSLIVVKDHVKTLKMAREVLEKMLL